MKNIYARFFIMLATVIAATACRQTNDNPDHANPSTPAIEAEDNYPEIAREEAISSLPAGATGDLSARDNRQVDARITEVSLSNIGDTQSGVIGGKRNRFAPNDVVYAKVETQARNGAYTLYAKWIASDGTILADYGTLVEQPGRQATVISLSKPDGWPSGLNRIELAINGQAAHTTAFEVP
ncbi:hypothetical protein [Pseudoxanthomonas wuyuanensis]|uniref:hypothetical protein n=1 Tax=Pseudoxanthomonas wuyuanensis TaxID=1073196 RepID=UPI001141B461|nr:hypothetical protein [Pseudoxanthomonas wuyuanensis]